MKAAFLTLGCKVNSYETEAVAELFREQGYDLVDEASPCDVVVINTCTVTNTGDAKSRQTIRGVIADHPGATVVVMGCYSQLQTEKVSAIDGVCVVLGTKDRHLAPQYVDEYRRSKTCVVRVDPIGEGDAFESMTIRMFAKHKRAFLKIEDGCDNFCSYCIIPYARGRVRSKDPAAVLSEANYLAAHGFAEIVLTGIHTGGYGKDLKNYRFADLLRELAAIEGLLRIRISSIEISELSDDVIDILASYPVFADHLHIPLQSGAERILKAMNRKYTKSDYVRKIAELRDRIPGISITTDVIAGFPGETEADFQEMLAFIREMRFSELHVFPYSRREGTVAAKLPDQVESPEKKRRVNALLALSDELAQDYVRENVGKTFVAIPESYEAGYLTGHTENYLRVRFQGDEALISKPIRIQLLDASYPVSPAVIETKK
ncbi:MAG: tRNA (N(6)-L-threonylcarbamoyladenosine(37)-C(2))-methylthiotransferase MtaB [Candidatus Omnitrophota bacterium]|nr:tRNA (N(6)-L-threonylcarbamoyladenosine(37)-C(2))-methylthiotransferase MtaB [Candidatus Omnitrophota bacterium]